MTMKRFHLWVGMIVALFLLMYTLTPTRAQSVSPIQKFVFSARVNDTSEIFTVNIDGSELQQLTFNDSFDSDPTWSPDGSQIAYTSDEGITIMDVDGSNQMILPNTEHRARPAWSPDGTLIAFDDSWDIYIYNLVNGTIQNLTNAPDRLDQSAEWSPDGSQLLFASSGEYEIPPATEVNTASMDIYVTDLNGNMSEFLSVDRQGLGEIDWGENGQILYTVSSLFSTEIYRFDINTNTVSLLSEPDVIAYSPSWSPDQSQIAFVKGGSLAVMDANGQNIFEILGDPWSIRGVEWQPPSQPILTCSTTVPSNDTAALITAIMTANGAGLPQTICLLVQEGHQSH